MSPAVGLLRGQIQIEHRYGEAYNALCRFILRPSLGRRPLSIFLSQNLFISMTVR